jgi:hypothetical protein
MQCEAQENAHQLSDDATQDPFIDEGLSSGSESVLSNNDTPLPRPTARRLQAARELREQLKRRLFRAQERQAGQLDV